MKWIQDFFKTAAVELEGDQAKYPSFWEQIKIACNTTVFYNNTEPSNADVVAQINEHIKDVAIAYIKKTPWTSSHRKDVENIITHPTFSEEQKVELLLVAQEQIIACFKAGIAEGHLAFSTEDYYDLKADSILSQFIIDQAVEHIDELATVSAAGAINSSIRYYQRLTRKDEFKGDPRAELFKSAIIKYLPQYGHLPPGDMKEMAESLSYFIICVDDDPHLREISHQVWRKFMEGYINQAPEFDLDDLTSRLAKRRRYSNNEEVYTPLGAIKTLLRYAEQNEHMHRPARLAREVLNEKFDLLMQKFPFEVATFGHVILDGMNYVVRSLDYKDKRYHALALEVVGLLDSLAAHLIASNFTKDGRFTFRNNPFSLLAEHIRNPKRIIQLYEHAICRDELDINAKEDGLDSHVGHIFHIAEDLKRLANKSHGPIGSDLKKKIIAVREKAFAQIYKHLMLPLAEAKIKFSFYVQLIDELDLAENLRAPLLRRALDIAKGSFEKSPVVSTERLETLANLAIQFGYEDIKKDIDDFIQEGKILPKLSPSDMIALAGFKTKANLVTSQL